jgi:hypothetical protein
MRTVLTHGLWYRLPDSTRVRALQLGADWQLLAPDRTPLYMIIGERVYRLVYNPHNRTYNRKVCDLQLDALRVDEDADSGL